LRIARLCVDNLGVTGAGISTMTGSGVRSVLCATDPVAELIETLQFTLGEGPCVDVVRHRSPVIIPDIARSEDLATGRWPAFMDGISATGVGALFAFPLAIGAMALGALDLYRDCPGDLPDAALEGALTAADAATLALLHGMSGPRASARDDLESHSLSFAQVHQATGMVQVQMGVSTEEAFLLVRAHAFASGRSVTDIARDVVQRRLRFSEEIS
jgi:hypothetical protein